MSAKCDDKCCYVITAEDMLGESSTVTVKKKED